MRSNMEQNQVYQPVVVGGVTSEQQAPSQQLEKVRHLSQTQINNELEIEDAREVKHEIRKILLTILILVLLVVTIYFINIKTDLILKMGEFVASKLNLNI